MLAAQPGVDRVENEFFDMRSDNNISYCITNRNGLTARVEIGICNVSACVWVRKFNRVAKCDKFYLQYENGLIKMVHLTH